MKQIWNSFRLAFSMYSVIPARQTEKTKENMKYILFFQLFTAHRKNRHLIFL